MTLTPQEAISIIESLRYGIPPPEDYISHLTVGRDEELKNLRSIVDNQKNNVTLIQANYGAGKTHLLKYIMEYALKMKYAVSYVIIDSQSGVRFNRMDQILGAILREIKIPGNENVKGIRNLFDLIFKKAEEARKSKLNNTFWHNLTNNWKWDESDTLESQSLYIAIRAWANMDSLNKDDVINIISDWLNFPWKYYRQRKYLYDNLVKFFRNNFIDPRPDWKFFDRSEGIFNFQQQSYAQSWACLRDINNLCKECGLKGFIIIFDEFEDVIYNLKNIRYQEAAFWNLFLFYSGKYFPGLSFYAVTPDFTKKCKTLLNNREYYDFVNFEELPKFEMSPLSENDLCNLSLKIAEIHNRAYKWKLKDNFKLELFNLVKKTSRIPIQNRTRNTIQEIIKLLDNEFDNGHK